MHSFEQAAVQAAGRAMLEYTELTVADVMLPKIESYQVITNVDPYQAQLINRMSRGALLVPGRTMLVLEVAPAAYVTLAVNEAEKAANIELDPPLERRPLRARAALGLGERDPRRARRRHRRDRELPPAEGLALAGSDPLDRPKIDRLRRESQVRTLARQLLYREYPRRATPQLVEQVVRT